MFRAIIFDFDGVVADSELLHYKGLNEAFGLRGVNVPEEVYYEKYLGYGDYECIEAVSGDYGMGLDAEGVEELFKYKTAVFGRLVKEETAIIDGVTEFVDMLRRNDILMAVCSGGTSSDIALMLAGTVLADAFEPIISADHVKKGKPHPEGFELALSRLNDTLPKTIGAEDCVVIEDSRWGLEAATAAGMHTIAVTNTYAAEQLSRYAQMVVDRLDVIGMDDLRGLCG
jgi:beta-phosphoglucomutase